jgi:hypothetical protein
MLAILPPAITVSRAQDSGTNQLGDQIQALKSAMAATQAQLEQSQRQLDSMRRQLDVLEKQVNPATAAPSGQSENSALTTANEKSGAQDLAAAVDDIREQQSIQATQIATHDQTKVETESRYPVKVTGLLLLNGFVNTRAVDVPATPSVSLFGPGNTGATVSQTIVGFDARGPHLAGAESYADLRVDFDGSPQPGSSTYSYNATLLRLRTAHAGLQWKHTNAYFSLDRPIFNPDAPTSLTAVALPALAWSGNLWTWNPQIGAEQDIPLAGTNKLQLQAAIIDVGQAPVTPRTSFTNTLGSAPTSAEASRWPGLDAHIALLRSTLRETGNRIGIGGHVAPLHDPTGRRYTSWAATSDAHLVLPGGLSVSANAYRGLALGGFGGGTYKDFVYYIEAGAGSYYFRPLSDVGGWAELKEEINQRVELNAAVGLDNAFAGELRPYAVPGGNYYLNLVRNRTATANVLLKPSAYLLFSLEYRRIQSYSILDRQWSSDVIGLGAGFKF